MKEESRIGKVTIVDKQSGELFDAPIVTSIRYYSIKKINCRNTTMSMMEKQAYICRGSKDIMVFWWILHKSKDNIFEKPTKIAKEIDVNYDKTMVPLIKRGIEAGMWKRIDRGVYLINPYVFLSRGISNKKAEELQMNHNTWKLDKKYKDWLNKIKRISNDI